MLQLTRRTLSFFTLCIHVIAIVLLFTEDCIDGYSFFSNVIQRRYYNPDVVVYMACAVLGLLVINCLGSIIYLFKDVSLIRSKYYIIISIITLTSFVFTSVIVGTVPFWYEYFYQYVNYGRYDIMLPYALSKLQTVFYIECIVLLFNILIECVKRFLPIPYKKEIAKNDRESSADELKKFKELFDSGAITQEEFDAKKKQLLGL